MSNTQKAPVFYAITLALAIVVRMTVPMIGEAGLLLTMLTPAAAVIIMLAFVAPEGGFRQAVNSLGLNRLGLKGWPLAIGTPLLIHGVGLVVLALAGLTVLVAPQSGGNIVQVGVHFVIGLFISTALALCEEVGWRGYMLPRLTGIGVISAMLVVGFLHGLWHMPILFTTDFYHSTGNPWIVAPLFLTTLTLAGIVYGFLRLWTGSVWPVAIAHAAANTAWQMATSVSQTKSNLVLEYVGGESGAVMIIGLLIIGGAVIWFMRGPRDKAAT